MPFLLINQGKRERDNYFELFALCVMCESIISLII